MPAEPLRIPCPNCQTVLKGPAEAAGKRVTCKKCGHSFTAGVTAEAISSRRPTPTAVPHPDVPEVELDAVPPAPAMGPTITYVCNKCGKHGQAPVHNAGMVFACGCGGVIEVPAIAEAIAVRRVQSREPEGRRSPLVALGVLLAFAGLVVLGLAYGMDTSVLVGGGTLTPSRVHNIGLMQERQLQFFLGGGMCAVGLVVLAIGVKK